MPAGDPPPASLTVLHYTGYTDDHSGVVSVIQALASARRFACVLGVGPGFVAHRAERLPTLEFPLVEAERIAPATWWAARRVARQAQRWLAAEPRRVFHGHSRAGLLAALWLNRWGERRVVATVHAYGRQTWFYRWSARRLGERLVWLTPAMKRHYGMGGPGWEGCIPNSLPRPPRAAPRPAPGARLVLGGAGMFVRWKCWELVIDAIARLPAAERARFEFRHIGADDGTADSRAYAAELRQRTEAAGLEGQVRWLGWQPSIEPLLAEVHAVVVPSRREPFSMVALEALFAGVPVIAADDGGPADFVRAGASGLFFRSGDAGELGRVLRAVLTTEVWGRLGIDPAELRRFETPVVAQQWVDLYERLLAPARPAPLSV